MAKRAGPAPPTDPGEIFVDAGPTSHGHTDTLWARRTGSHNMRAGLSMAGHGEEALGEVDVRDGAFTCHALGAAA